MTDILYRGICCPILANIRTFTPWHHNQVTQRFAQLCEGEKISLGSLFSVFTQHVNTWGQHDDYLLKRLSEHACSDNHYFYIYSSTCFCKVIVLVVQCLATLPTPGHFSISLHTIRFLLATSRPLPAIRKNAILSPLASLFRRYFLFYTSQWSQLTSDQQQKGSTVPASRTDSWLQVSLVSAAAAWNKNSTDKRACWIKAGAHFFF